MKGLAVPATTPELGKTVRQFVRPYLSARENRAAAMRAIMEKIGALEEAQKELRAEADRLDGNTQSWIEAIIRPIAEAMAKHLPGYDFEIYGPFGIPCNTSVWFRRRGVTDSEKYKGDNLLHIGFRPVVLNDPEKTLALIDYATDTRQYAGGSTGGANELNHPSRPLPPDTTVLDLLMWMREQSAAQQNPVNS